MPRVQNKTDVVVVILTQEEARRLALDLHKVPAGGLFTATRWLRDKLDNSLVGVRRRGPNKDGEYVRHG